jgi:hypothetical protein
MPFWHNFLHVKHQILIFAAEKNIKNEEQNICIE